MKTLLAILTFLALGSFPALAQNNQQPGKLTRAEYGIPGQMADVTYLVSLRIQHNNLNFRVSNDDLGGDPAPGQRKLLRIWLRRSWWDNRSYDFPEGSTVNLQLSSDTSDNYPGQGTGTYPGQGSQQFVRADYGIPGQFADVTSRIQRLAQNGVFSCRVSHDCFDVDPAPGVRKLLRVTSRGGFGNSRYTDYSDGETVTIPVGTSNGDNWGGNSWIILHAEYGLQGRQSVDVTDRVRGLVQNNALNFVAGNDALGGDPAHGHKKQLFLAIRQGFGGEQNYTFREGETVNLQLGYGNSEGGSGRTWSVTRAQYGIPGRYMDVTQTVARFLVNNSLHFRVSNDTFGRDPAEDHHKNLIVRLRDWQGREEVLQYDEGDDVSLQLP